VPVDRFASRKDLASFCEELVRSGHPAAL
jgi:hypothetical protein